jgi:hypothetical protein
VRIGAMTWGQMVRELGYDPTEQLDEIEEYNKLARRARHRARQRPAQDDAAGQQQATPGGAERTTRRTRMRRQDARAALCDCRAMAKAQTRASRAAH